MPAAVPHTDLIVDWIELPYPMTLPINQRSQRDDSRIQKRTKQSE